nr:hypothetical protein [Tanacetum cinerariifolium]
MDRKYTWTAEINNEEIDRKYKLTTEVKGSAMRSVMVVTSSKSGSNSNGVMYKEEGIGKVNGDGNEGSVDEEDNMWSMRSSLPGYPIL